MSKLEEKPQHSPLRFQQQQQHQQQQQQQHQQHQQQQQQRIGQHQMHPLFCWLQKAFPQWPSYRHETLTKIGNEVLYLMTKELGPWENRELESSERRIVDFNALAERFMYKNPCFPV